ncbi:uncharacterized protein LOC117223536 [Megalopta genalis]|uniref:uncharacterized protein LOC117223536 n=1 Tax=Megalopta genalis TaxID=115081 RepID=UPI003FCF2811
MEALQKTSSEDTEEMNDASIETSDSDAGERADNELEYTTSSDDDSDSEEGSYESGIECDASSRKDGKCKCHQCLIDAIDNDEETDEESESIDMRTLKQINTWSTLAGLPLHNIFRVIYGGKDEDVPMHYYEW